MDYKKIIILPLLFVGSTLLYIGCCHCVEHSKKFFQPDSLRVATHGTGYSIIDTGAVATGDSIYLDYSFMGECVATNKMDLSFLVSSAQALSCDCIGCGSEGFKNTITGISITSDSIYNNIPAGQPLNDFFKMYDQLPFDSLQGIMNRKEYIYSFGIYTVTKPANNKGHIFKLDIRFDNGDIITGNTRRTYWQ